MCVRIGSLRCHSQALTVKLRRDVPLGEIERMLATANDWVTVVPNEKEASLRDLTPTAVSGTLKCRSAVSRSSRWAAITCAFTVGDQLLWGAAEPLRRMLRILLESTADTQPQPLSASGRV